MTARADAVDEPQRVTRVLVIGGSDPSSGAGVQADLRTLTALGCYGLSALTAVTAQSAREVYAVAPLGAELVEAQVRAALEDGGADAVKTGMLATGEAVEAVARLLARLPSQVPVVVDPVLVSTSGRRLLDEAGESWLRRRLLPVAAVVTPNADEACALTGVAVVDADSMRDAASRLLLLGPRAVLLKGGHVPATDEAGLPVVRDLLVTQDGDERWFETERVGTRAFHGTGCILASALAAGLAEGRTLADAVERARALLTAAMRAAPAEGRGAGLLFLDAELAARALPTLRAEPRPGSGDARNEDGCG